MPGFRRALVIATVAVSLCAVDAEDDFAGRVQPNRPGSVPSTYTPPPFTEPTEPVIEAGQSAQFFNERPVQDAAVRGASFSTVEPPPLTDFQEVRTPIGRGGEPASSDPDRPSAAATLRRGMWSSGTAVVLLAVVGGAIVWTIRKRNPQLSASLPREAIDLLGRQRVDARNAVGLLRVGSRLLIVGIGEDGLRTLGEVTDPAEVDQLSGLCRTAGTGGGFSAMLQKAVPTPTAATPRDSEPRPRTPQLADLPGLRDRPRLDVTTP